MRHLFLLITAFCAVSMAFGQLENPVQWTFAATKKADKAYEVVITATLAKPWHIYSQTTPDGGPAPTKIVFKANPLFVKDGAVKETGSLQTIHDQNFGVDVKYYSDKVVFTQLVKLKAGVKTHATGDVEYMVCNDSKCLPPKKLPFDILLQ